MPPKPPELAQRIAFAAVLLFIAACATPQKINESNWVYELERNAFEKKWTAFNNSLTDAQADVLGKLFRTGAEPAIAEFEKSLDDLKRFKFTHLVEAAAVTEKTRRETAAKLERTPVPQISAFDQMKIIPGKPTELPTDDDPAPPTGECLQPDQAYTQAFAEGQARRTANPLPADRKEIEEISHRLYPYGLARFWKKRAAELCVTAATIKNT